MPRCTAVLLAIVALGTAAPAEDTPPGTQVTAGTTPVPAVRGVWKITELASRVPGADWEARAAPYLSQYVFTDTHFSYMYVPGTGPRKLFAGDPNRPSDAEKVEAYNSLVAGTGTYSLSGQALRLDVLIHKNPNEMTGKPLTYRIEGDATTLRMVIADPPFLPGREWRTVLTRVE